MRLLLLLMLVIAIALLLVALRRRALKATAATAGDRYRVLQTTSESDAQVYIARPQSDSGVLIGSVPITSEDFDERYAELIVRAEDRVATLNASRSLHDGA